MKNTLKKLTGDRLLRAYHAVRSHAVAARFGHPGRDMIVIGITGTNGKTTTAHLVASILEAAGLRVALMSTIRFRVAGVEWVNESKMTVPTPSEFNRFLARARRAHCTHLIMEATSIALDQQRMAGLTFDCGVLTNITHDHLDYHGTFAAYVQAKRQLFARGLRVSVVNMDDPQGLDFASLPASVHINYSLDPARSDVLRPAAIVVHSGGTTFRCVLPDGQDGPAITTTLTGNFNISNILAAVGVALGLGVQESVIEQAVTDTKLIPGRMEEVSCGQNFRVFIDYAHTPDALEKMYQALVPIQKARMISVLGATGDRDKTKRPLLGAIAAEHADLVVVTNEDPWSEQAEVIMEAVAVGVRQNKNHTAEATFWKILDRREAIRKAFSLARAGDIVTITGKGDETGMGVGHQIIPWSDRLVAEEELRQRTEIRNQTSDSR